MSAPTTQAGTGPEDEKPVAWRWRLKAEFNGQWGPGAWVLSPQEVSDANGMVEVEPLYDRSNRDTETAALQAELERESKESYEIGKRDGYEKAVQHIDERTGGDGEYCCVVGHDSDDRHCPDPEGMISRIVGRFEKLSTSEQQLSELRAEMETGRAERNDARRRVRTANAALVDLADWLEDGCDAELPTKEIEEAVAAARSASREFVR